MTTAAPPTRDDLIAFCDSGCLEYLSWDGSDTFKTLVKLHGDGGVQIHVLPVPVAEVAEWLAAGRPRRCYLCHGPLPDPKVN
jgi:hypothetical protein